ncbi:uncharacterized protein BYT42DRAFT_498160 [Radiomyces spectabilis]|uniref:uncharacterized protein n=1 Tax=Radiomyces spectabilis TaxID=64574 RepID=UPI00221FC93D|nr:uncharacterized protein BYT42DRAFT_498160 [Radiomyces spectabilis]KAI8376289.1 hypothetical protein BYT42DRAFT_498160 [Radiomyces spectabilis]
MVQNKQVIFTKVPTTFPEDGEHMQVRESTIDLDAHLTSGEIILKNLALSVDPYMRGRMRDPSVKSYSPAFPLNQPMTGSTMSVVVKSNHPKFKEGDLVYGNTGMGIFEEYTRVGGVYLEKAYTVRNEPKENGLPITNYLGVLGMPGMTAYVGLFKIGAPKKGETLYVSAASGAVGQLVGQMGKAFGLHVVGSAGSDEKVEYLKSIGFDGVFNYKTEDIDDKLGELCPNGIDIYFENVGGKMLECVIKRANNFARIVACGMISQYNREHPEPIHNLMQVVAKRLRIEGFIVGDHLDMEQEFREKVTKMLLNKEIQYKESVAHGIENTPKALIDVLRGKNFGKQVVKIADL